MANAIVVYTLNIMIMCMCVCIYFVSFFFVDSSELTIHTSTYTPYSWTQSKNSEHLRMNMVTEIASMHANKTYVRLVSMHLA